jgi:hypothetical protein
MAVDPSALISVSWDIPSRPRYATLDAITPGFLFGGEEPLSNIDRYEVEVFNTTLNTYISKGYFYTNQAEILASDLGDAKLRIRAITRDGIKSEFAESGTFSLYGFTSIFSEARNTIFLSFV